MRKTFGLAIAGLLICSAVSAQYTRHIVQFRDKKGTTGTLANPATYLSAKAIERRTKQNLPVDSTDLPISKDYLDSIASVPNVTILNQSKWLNQILIRTSDAAALAKINSFPFVKNNTAIAPRIQPGATDVISRKIFTEEFPVPESARIQGSEDIQLDYGNTGNQIRIHKGEFLHNLGFTGQTMTIAILDAGFLNYKTNPALDSVRNQGRILGEWDYVANHASVNEDNSHGANCFTIIAANRPGVIVGSSPHSKFWLLRTEDAATEYPVEEQNWAAAAEFSDSAGVDMISSSLGYADFDNPAFNYSHAQRDGNTSIVTRAADLAAKKGIIVMNSAGNSGNSSTDYKYVGCPADGDSVVAVGAIDINGNIASFSSWGPNGANKLKPNIVSVGAGTVYANSIGNAVSGNGTSYSNPNIAGLIACFWQAFPELNNMQLIDAVQRSAHKYNNPDMRFGYGIPNFRNAFVSVLQQRATFTATVNACVATVNWESKDNTAMSYKLQRRLPQDTGFITIATINGKTEQFAKNNYSYNDTLRNFSGNALYRIQQVIGADTTFLLGSGGVSIAAPCVTTSGTNFSITPNPVRNGTLQLKISSSETLGALQVVITDLSGRIVSNRTISATLGNSIQRIPVNHLPAGVYVVRVMKGSSELWVGQAVKN